ncbi:FadR/GntR family transcriptional regulator [Asticcacaulis machinosus]|uniref:FCD domain-containing protein n=1 Tax=Asticcacaulis machinosus TaxID=2984211 RepID=A0ABT5HIR9_9CAUL|nr:FCD domain-containing protein [Asticcacaulis machinosus]MDC7676141.1 FCD domain-containing protein [Asticcacaulis machinosus]
MVTVTKFGSNMTVQLQMTLGQMIVAGHFDEVPFPNEAELSTMFDASRTVVREAIKMLTAKGLISTRQRGERLLPMRDWNLLDPDVSSWLKQRPFSADTYREYTQMRLAIEPVAAGLVAASGGPEVIRQINSALDALNRADADAEQQLQATLGFHHAILMGSRNAFFTRLTELVTTALHLEASALPANAYSNQIREQIGNAIRHGDAPGAEAMMRELLRSSLRQIEAPPA